MRPFPFRADERGRERKCGNYADDKSRMHLPNPTRQQHPSRVCGANCHAIFCKAKPDKGALVEAALNGNQQTMKTARRAVATGFAAWNVLTGQLLKRLIAPEIP